MNSKDKEKELVRPGDPRVPCFAILGRDTSELQLVNLEGGSSSSVKISDLWSLGIVTNNGEVFAVTVKEILKLRSDGAREHVAALPRLDVCSRVALFQKKIYIIQPKRSRMLCFDPADNSLTDDLPGCGLGDGFCAAATDDEFILSMGGSGTETQTMKFDPLKLKWKKKAQMRKKRYRAAAATLDGKIYVMGGLHHGTSVEYYNPDNNSWTETSDMNAYRFSACVDGDRLYAVGGGREGKNGFWQHSIEVYDKNKSTVVTKFQAKGHWIHSCIWPHGSHQPDSTRSKDSPGPLENTYSLLKSEDLLEAKTKVGSKEEKFNYPGLKFNLSEDAMKEEKEVTLSARVGVDQKEGMPDITPTYECDPPLTFEKPVSMTMRTSISAPAGKEIAVSLLTRDQPGDEWKETQRLSMGPINEVDFEVDRFGGIKVAAECSGVMFHSYSGFHINLDTGKTAVTFSKDQAVHDLLEKSLRKIDYVHFDVVNHEILAKFGSKISVSMERKKPEDSTLSKPYPSPSFKLDEKYLLKGKHIVYFDLDPEPSDQCRTISMEYECQVNGEPEQCLSLKTKWPRSKGDSDNKFRGSTLNNFLADKEARSGGNNYNNCLFYPTANQVAIGGDVNMYDTKNIAGDVSTVVNAPVGQLATGNGNITNQGAGNNFVAGSQENTDRSVATGKAIYGQFGSSSVDP